MAAGTLQDRHIMIYFPIPYHFDLQVVSSFALQYLLKWTTVYKVSHAYIFISCGHFLKTELQERKLLISRSVKFTLPPPNENHVPTSLLTQNVITLLIYADLNNKRCHILLFDFHALCICILATCSSFTYRLSIRFSNFSSKMSIFISPITKCFKIFLGLTFQAGIELTVENYWQLPALKLASLD